MKQKNIHKTNDFVTNKITIRFTIPHTKKDEVMLSFLANLMGDSTAMHKTSRALNIYLEELYDTSFSFGSFVKGNYLHLELGLSYLNGKEFDLEDSIYNLIKELIFHPNIENGEWNKLDFDDMMDWILFKQKTFQDDPAKYAAYEGLKRLDKESTAGNPYYMQKEVNEITRESIYKYYQALLKKAAVRTYFVGKFNADFIKKITDTFSNDIKFDLPVSREHTIINNDISKAKQVKELEQAVFFMGFKMMPLTTREEKYVLRVFNYLFGQSPANGKLFVKIRNERGLVYTIRSNADKFERLLWIEAGFDKENVKLVTEISLESLEEMKQGDFKDEALRDAIVSFVAAFKSTGDDINHVMDALISADEDSIDPVPEMIKNIKTVTKEEIMELAKKIVPQNVFVLEGGKK